MKMKDDGVTWVVVLTFNRGNGKGVMERILNGCGISLPVLNQA